MSLLTINITNRTARTESFYLFQEKMTFMDARTDEYVHEVYRNSLYSQTLAPADQSGATLTIQIDSQAFACVEVASGKSDGPSGYAPASEAINLAGYGNDTVTAYIHPPSPTLSKPTRGMGVIRGCFRIVGPDHDTYSFYNAGAAVRVNGQVVMSAYTPQAKQIDCAPLLKFFVGLGSAEPGWVTEVHLSRDHDAALCDFTRGASVIDVTRNADGTWSTRTVR